MPRLRLVLPLLLLVLSWTGASRAETVWYVGHDPDGRTVVLELDTAPDADLARGRMLHGPARAGRTGGLDLAFEAPFEPGDRLRLEAVASGADGVAVGLTIEADVVRGAGDAVRPPDPFGEARIEVAPVGDAAPWTTTLAAIGTRYAARAALDDGSFELVTSAPFFYADPWRTLPLHDDPVRTAASLVAGLTARAERPASVAGRWWEERSTEIASLSPRLVSARTDVRTYAGGAHPNLRYAFVNAAWDGAAWVPVDVCGALQALNRACDEAALRARVVADLRAQEAAWALDGEIDEATPWLLDRFTVGPAGLRFDYAPYEVGPYASGPYAVEVPFDDAP